MTAPETQQPLSEVYPDYDVLIIGAGFSGLWMLYEARGCGLLVCVLEAGCDVGGTWNVNRYPGARTGSEGWVYCFGFDKGLQDEWDWWERYPTQPRVLSYLRYVAERFGMRGDIQFGTRVRSAVFDEAGGSRSTSTPRSSRPGRKSGPGSSGRTRRASPWVWR
jgi:cyclohexanone monooxygenase